VRFEYRNLAFLSETSTLAAEAALCAADQGQFWPYHDLIFANQALLFEPDTNARRALKQMADTLGLDSKTFDRCFDNRQHRQEVIQSLDEGHAQGITSTPTVFVNGRDLGYPQSLAEIQAVIEQELAQAGQ